MEELSGQTIKGYEIHERIGAGGYGAVYRAYQPAVRREVAIKVILPQFANHPEFIQRFEAEAHLIARLEHPFIVPLYDYWHEPNGSIYLVMRWLRGGSLRDRLASGPLAFDLIAQITDQIAQALTVAHQAGIVHRDLKPDNILFDDRQNAYLTDFGIAKEIFSAVHITTASGIPATPSYAAPEHVAGEPVTPLADIYSLGLTLYECVTGEHPFPKNPMQHLHRSLPSLQKRRPDAPAALNPVLARATAKIPARRFSDALSLAQAVHQALTVQRPALTPALPHAPEISPTTAAVPFDGDTQPLRSKAEAFVFISHSTQDDRAVDRIREALAAKGIHTWVDHADLKPGEPWDEIIDDRLNDCTDGLFVLSRHSIDSDECHSEWRAILELDKPLYIALIDDIPPAAFPYRLRMIQYVDLHHHFDEEIAKLVATMIKDRQQPAPGPRLPTAPSPGDQSAILYRRVPDVESRARKLIGRDETLRQIEALFEQQQCVSLQGMGGMGKTALAAEIAARRIEQGQGPVLWLEAGNGNTDLCLEALARALTDEEGFKQIVQASGRSKIQKIRELLIDEKIKLVVFDNAQNAEALEQIANLLPRDLLFLTTSRERYPACSIIDVETLDLPEAVNLLRFHAGPYAADEAEALDLCQWLGCHPLAVNIAGRSLMTDRLTPAELKRRISEPYLLKVGQASIQLVLEDSVRALDADTRGVFLAFGALAAPRVTPPLLTLVTQRDPGALENALETLQRRNLTRRTRLQNGKIIYPVHELIYSYVRAHAIIDRPVFVKACQVYSAEFARDLPALDAERSNLIGAAQAAQQAGLDDLLIEIMIGLAVQAAYFEAVGPTPQAFDLLRAAIGAAEKNGRPKDEHYLRSKRANLYANFMGDIEAALDDYSRALELARALGDTHREAILLVVIGTTRLRQGKTDGDTYYSQAYDIARLHADDDVLCMLFEHRGHQARFHDDFRTARRWFAQSLKIAKQINAEKRIYFAVLNLGDAERHLRHGQRALVLHARALELAQRLGYGMGVAKSQESLGMDWHAMGNRAQAQICLDQALALCAQNNARSALKEIVRFMQQNDYVVRFDQSSGRENHEDT